MSRAAATFGILLLGAPAAASANGRVELHVAGTPEAAAALEGVVRELLDRLGVALEAGVVEHIDLPTIMTPVSNAPDTTARVWIDLGTPGVALVHVVDGSWTRLLVRRVPVTGDFDEIEREEVGHILEAAVEALLAGRVVGEPWVRDAPEAAPAPVTPEGSHPPGNVPPPTAPVSHPAGRLDLGARYEVQGFHGDRLAHGPGLHLALGLGRGRLRPFATLSTSLSVPFTVRTTDLAIELVGLRARLVVGLGWKVAGPIELFACVGPGLDLWHDEPRVRARSTTSAASARWTTLAMGRAALGIAWTLAGRVRVWVGAGLDLDATDLRFTVRSASGVGSPLDPPRARPTALLGVDLLDS